MLLARSVESEPTVTGGFCLQNMSFAEPVPIGNNLVSLNSLIFLNFASF